jgi:hypothetical protein
MDIKTPEEISSCKKEDIELKHFENPSYKISSIVDRRSVSS